MKALLMIRVESRESYKVQESSATADKALL